MRRKEDLEGYIRESYELIRQYETISRQTDRPEERKRATRVIDEQQHLIKSYLAEYISLCEHLGLAVAQDLIDIAIAFGSDLSPDISRIEARYVSFLRRQYGHVPLGGIAPRVQGRALSIPLDELFVPLQAEPDAPLQTQFVMSGVRGFQAVRSPDPRLVGLDEIATQPHVVILGEPGAGKSTLLRWLVAQTLKSTDGSKEDSLSPDAFPVFIRLVDFATVLERQPGMSLARYLREQHLPEYRALFERLLANGQGWLLLDGLDEVADSRRRREVRSAIETFAAQFPDFHIVVTSRIVGYRSAQITSGFRQFTLQPFGPDEIAHFIRNWYRAVYRLTEGVPDNVEVERRANRLLEGLKDKPQVFQLAGTPLLLAIIALMDWKGKEIPKRRVELYKVATETLLEDWPAEQGRPVEGALSVPEMLEVLAPLAYHMFEMGFTEAIHLDELKPRVINLIQQVRGCSHQAARDLADDWLGFLSEHSGLLLDAGIDEFHDPVYAFLHLSFAEYLSGRALAKQWCDGQIDLTCYVNDPRWREVVLLMAGHIGMQSVADATHLVDEIYSLEPPHHDVLHQSLVLAAACLADDVQVAPPLRARILGELIPLWHRGTSGLLRSKLFRILAAMRGTDSATEVIERIVPLLDDDRVWVRSSVLELLGKLSRPTDLTLKARLLDALHDSNARVQHAAVRALETLGLAHDPDVRAALLRALQQSDSRVRTRAALALGTIVEQYRDVQLALLHTLAQDDDADVRQMAARVLSMVDQPDNKVVTSMLASLQDPNRGVRKEAAASLMRWSEDSRNRLIATLHHSLQNPNAGERRKTIRMIADFSAVLGQQVTNWILEIAETDDNPSVRARAIQELASVSSVNERVVSVLLDALESTDRIGRRYAPLSLKHLGIHDERVARALVAALRDRDTVARRNAAGALAKCGRPTPATVHGLENALIDRDEFVRLYAAETLVELGTTSVKAYKTLITSLHSENSEIRRRAAQGLRRFIHRVDASVITALTELVADDNREVQEQALLALGELGHKAAPEVVVACRAALRDDYHWTRMRAAEALGKLGQADMATIDALLASLTDSNARVRLAASEALIALGGGPERETIIDRVRAFLNEQPHSEDALNTLWGLVVGE